MDNFVFSSSCPLPIQRYSHITLAHGGGGTLMRSLIDSVILPAFGDKNLDQLHDSAVMQFPQGRLAFTTDSYVVHPLFFPGGDIGSLAVHGTVNDLAMSGAQPLWLSVGFILEEGLPLETLQRIVHSMRRAADQTGTAIVTGDTKVVDKGKGDGVFINTAGIGVIEHALEINPQQVKVGDAVLINGDIGRHGIAVMAAREGLEFESGIKSDSAPLADLVMALIAGGVEIHCLRDLTRGGLASALNEIAHASQTMIAIDERAIPVCDNVKGACEMLGFDPLYVANEGRFAAFVAPKDKEKAFSILSSHPLGAGASIIGEVKTGAPAVVMKSQLGAMRIVDLLSGEQLPRIC
ncbi:MAG: hydrogenase expression/formation protein HypE [Candidatus Omnitrophota bacterium]